MLASQSPEPSVSASERRIPFSAAQRSRVSFQSAPKPFRSSLRATYDYNEDHERGGQQDGLFAEMLDRREQGKKNQAGGEERQDGGQAGDGDKQAREGAEDQG